MRPKMPGSPSRRRRASVSTPSPAAGESTTPPLLLDELDYERLARLNLTGGNIHSVALNAAFRAAHSGTPAAAINE